MAAKWSDEKEVDKLVKKYCKIKYSRSGGPGGQNVNKRNTAVQITCSEEDLRRVSIEMQRRGIYAI